MFQSHDDLFDAIAHLRYLITAESSTAEGVESSYEIGEDAQRFGALSCVLLRLETICEQQRTLTVGMCVQQHPANAYFVFT